MLRTLWKDESGVIVSAELALIMTIGVLAIVVGISEVAVAVNTELNDISNAFGALNQSYAHSGFRAVDNGKTKSYSAGSAFNDGMDDCDNNYSCDIVCGANPNAMEGMMAGGGGGGGGGVD